MIVIYFILLAVFAGSSIYALVGIWANFMSADGINPLMFPIFDLLVAAIIAYMSLQILRMMSVSFEDETEEEVCGCVYCQHKAYTLGVNR
jgi:hypothetical protein